MEPGLPTTRIQDGEVSIKRVRKQNDNTYAWIVAFCMGIVVALSLNFFSHQSLRLDEAQSLWQTSHSTIGTLGIVVKDVHVPLYHIILHFWQYLFGNDVMVARYLSLIFFILIIPAIYMLGKLAYGPKVGLYGAILMTISPFLNWYGNEIRMYSLFALLTILNQYFYLSISIRSKEDREVRSWIWLGYVVTVVLGVFTHYFFIFNLVSQAIFYVFYRKVFPKNTWKNFLAVILIAAAAFSPWVYYVVTFGTASSTQPSLSEPKAIDVFNTFSQFIFGFQDDRVNTILVSLWPLIVLGVFLSLRRNYRVPPQTVYFIFCLFLPISIAFAVSVGLKPVYLTRYLILTLPSLYLIISWIISIYPVRLANTIRVALVLVMLTTLTIEIVNAQTPVKENYREASAYLTEHAAPQDIIVLSAPFTIYPFEYYYRGTASIETLPRWDRLKVGPIPPFSIEELPAEVAKIKDARQKLWLLLSYDQGYEEDIRLYFDTNFERLEHRNFSPGLNLYLYRLRYDTELPELN